MTLEHQRSSRPLASWRTLACSLLLSLVAASLGAQDAGRPRGRLFIVGGRTQPPARANVVLDSGFALMSNVIVDQHFVRRKRPARGAAALPSAAP